jgi:aryl-alcohol dehydrogenase-like predicted oxidoreductase
MGEGPNNRGLSRKHLFESIEGTLRRLGTDYLDIYFCHRHDPRTSTEEVVMAMTDLIRQGKVLYWGTSVWPAAKLTEAALTAQRLLSYAPRAEQPRYNMLDRHIEVDVLPTAASHGIGLVVWSPLAQGVLTGKYKAGIPAGSRAERSAGMRRAITPETVAAVEALRPIAQDLGLTLAQLALAWCLRRPEVSSVITGASRPEQVRENVKASGLRLPEEANARIEEILGNRPEVEQP